ncbi:uncharacterized protein LOC125043006 [Penaeus chinensis]|uniref:uncharacterized protein LOC125043006 n=1 Tax=Penaeus chinensis TaxID=139456 RepID=UPI001FB80DD8|nr:uncharacterized protein LOC125043006 [Penaeus chinensis]
MSQSTSLAVGGPEDLLPEPDVGNDTLEEIDCEMKAVEEFMEGIREEKRDVSTAIRNLFFFCEALLRDVCRWRDRRQNRAGHKKSSVLKEPAEKECAEAEGETSPLSGLTAEMQDLNVKGDEGQEEEHSNEDQGSKEERDSGSVEWEAEDDIEGEQGEEVNLHEDSLLVDNKLLDIEDAVDELRDSPSPDLDSDDDAEMSVEFLQSLVGLVRKELAAAEEEREVLERHEKSLTEEFEALNESRTSLLNASACERKDGSLNVPVATEAESRGHEGEDEQAPSIGENPMDPSTAGELSEDATCALQTTEEEPTLCVRLEAPPAVGEAAGEATCLLEPKGKTNPTLAVSQDLSRAEDIGYFAAQTERN